VEALHILVLDKMVVLAAAALVTVLQIIQEETV
jgi:hypothetical protein